TAHETENFGSDSGGAGAGAGGGGGGGEPDQLGFLGNLGGGRDERKHHRIIRVRRLLDFGLDDQHPEQFFQSVHAAGGDADPEQFVAGWQRRGLHAVFEQRRQHAVLHRRRLRSGHGGDRDERGTD